MNQSDDEEEQEDSTTTSFSQSAVSAAPQPTQQETQGDQPLLQTLSGGTAMIFEMARRMLVWEDLTDLTAWSNGGTTSKTITPPPSRVLPRWRPYGGVVDANPSFRTLPPAMNSQGYAAAIWRNVRKRNKPSLWRHALRLYNRMSQLEEDGGSSTAPKKIQRANIHYEGALLACAKLGLWQRALQIFRQVEEDAAKNADLALIKAPSALSNLRHPKPSSKTTTSDTLSADPSITENMVLSLVRACVRGSKSLDKNEATIDERRQPLDAAQDILRTIEQRHGIPLVARHLNPLSSAYQSLGLLQESSLLLAQNLANRTLGPESEDGVDPLNVHDIGAKDKASYALLVTSAVSSGDWAEAIDALRDMTEAGVYPNGRHVNAWTEVSERKTRQRTTRSWKKKRDEIYWLESIR